MNIVILRFGANGVDAATHMAGHKAWIKRGMDDGVFLLVGSLTRERGGVILVDGMEYEALRERVAEDPFVAYGVVDAEIVEVEPAMAEERLKFLVA